MCERSFQTRVRAALAAGLLAMLPALAIAAPDPDGAAAADADSRALAGKIDAYLQAAVRYEQFSGSVLVARKGVPIFRKGYGMANYELAVPNTPDTVFHIASLTKQFTAMAILQLREQGKLEFGDPICKYIDDCPPTWQPITLRHLLAQSSGLQNPSSLPDWDEDFGRKSYRRHEFLRLFRDLPLQFAPGEKFKYSNSNYFLLGMVIERVSGQRYGDYLDEAIFKPLGMRHSRHDDNRTLIPGRATGYYSRGTDFVGALYLDPTTTFSSGGITSTVDDLLAWDQALYTDKLVSRAALAEMFTANQGNYGYGWQVGEKFGRRKLDHSGSLNGFSSYILRFPDEQLAVIVLSNSDRTSAGKAGTNLAAIMFGQPYELPREQLRDLLWQTIVDQGSEAALAQYHELKRSQPDRYVFGEEPLVELGYDLLDARKLAEATAIFNFSLALHPASAYSLDGLADIAIEQGDRKRAVELFEKSLALDPGNDYASRALERLQRARD